MRLNPTASPDVKPLGWVSLQKHFSHLPCNLVIYILSVREPISSAMEGLYLSHPCILVPYHKSWPLVVAQQEQAEFNAWFYRLRSYINDDHVKHLGCGLRMGCAVCVLSGSVLSNSSATPWTVAHQVPLSLGLPRQGYWSGLPFLPPYLTTNPRVIFSVT